MPGLGADWLAKDENCRPVSEVPVRGDPGISGVCDHSEQRDMRIQPKQNPVAYGDGRERFENGMRAATHRAVGGDQINSALQGSAIKGGESIANLLGWNIFEAIATKSLPVLEPDTAEPAMAVIDESPSRRSGHRCN